MTSNSLAIPRSLYSLHHERACTKGGALAYSRLFGPLSRLSSPQLGQWLPLGWPALYLYFHLYLFVFVATKFSQFDLAMQSVCHAIQICNAYMKLTGGLQVNITKPSMPCSPWFGTPLCVSAALLYDQVPTYQSRSPSWPSSLSSPPCWWHHSIFCHALRPHPDIPVQGRGQAGGQTHPQSHISI